MALSCGATVMFFFHFHLIQCFFIRMNEWMHEWIIEICKQMKDYNKSPYLYWDFDRKWQFNVPFTYSLRFHSNSIQFKTRILAHVGFADAARLVYSIDLLYCHQFDSIELKIIIDRFLVSSIFSLLVQELCTYLYFFKCFELPHSSTD